MLCPNLTVALCATGYASAGSLFAVPRSTGTASGTRIFSCNETEAAAFSRRASSRYDLSASHTNPVRHATAASYPQVKAMLTMNSGNLSFAPPPSRGTYEIKFLIDDSSGQVIRDWARTHLQPDPHSSPEFGDGYAVNSLYLDTPAFDVYHRGEGFRQRKYRLRRYGSESAVWMELKRKNDGRVRKRRTRVSDTELPGKLLFSTDESWDGRWFQQRLEKLQLRPVCQVTYQRIAYIGTSIHGPIRLTIDSGLCCQPANGWVVPAEALTTNVLLRQHQILELKYRETIPNSFRGLIEDLRLTMSSFSKYRQGVEACIPLQQLIAETYPDRTAG